MWSVVDGALLWSRDDVPTSWLAVSPDGTRLVTSEFRVDPQDPDRNHPDWFPGSTQVRLWDLADHRVVMTDTLPGEVDDYGHTPKPRSVAFSPDSSKVAVSFFTPIDLLMVYDAHTGKNLAKVTLDSQADFDSAFAVVFTPDSSRLLVEDGKGVVTDRDPLTGLSGWTLDTTHADYSALAFTSDGGRFVTFAGTSLDIWDASTRAGLLNGVTIPTTNGDGSLAPTSDGHLFIGSERGILRLDTDPERWNEVACRIADRRLTQDEWTRYLAGHPYAPACRAESTGTSSARS
jgi:WD40 repeat protein